MLQSVLQDQYTTIVCLQYCFGREERLIVAKEPHSKAKKEIAFICAKPSVLEKSKSIEKLPKTIVSEVLQESGGFEGVLRNRKQIYNAKLRLKEEKDEVVEIRDFYKREQNSQLHFIREVNLVPKVSVFVSTEQQLIDIERFYTKTSHFFILGFDSTYNAGSYYVTISTYRHLMFRTKESIHPLFMGPSLIHTDRTYYSHYKLPESMIKTNKNLKNILVFGTD